MNSKPQYFYGIALAGFLGLFTLMMLWPTVLSPATHMPVALMLLITVTPLLLPMRGMLAKKPKSCAWMAYISLGYFVHGAIETYANAGGRLYPALEVVLSLMLFFGATLFVYFSGKTA